MSEVIYSIIVPLYNEEQVIYESYKRLKAVMDTTSESYELIFVNDGSSDSTKEKAAALCIKDRNLKLVNFSRNFGHQAAITAGMEVSMGAAVIVIDADLQDPPEIILSMIRKWKEGFEVVYGKRKSREGESLFKRSTAKAFYRILRSTANIEIPVDTGDFRLIDRKVCEALKALPEKNRYVRGLVSWVGFKQTFVEFERQERFAGTTKYPLRKMLKLAFDGITSFSFKPLAVAGYIGGITLVVGLFSFMGITINSLLNNTGFMSLGLILSINFILFGILLCCLGIIGQYIGRIFEESKNRPNYIIESLTSYREASAQVEATNKNAM